MICFNFSAWLTPDLQQAIATNSILGPKLADPKFASLLEEFQQDPQETLRKHADNPQMKSFLQEFCRIMGEHFTRLGEAQDQLSKATVQKDEEADLIRPVKTKSLKSSANASSAAQGVYQQSAVVLGFATGRFCFTFITLHSYIPKFQFELFSSSSYCGYLTFV